MTLEACGASAAAQNKCGQHGQSCKDPAHLKPPFARLCEVYGG